MGALYLFQLHFAGPWPLGPLDMWPVGPFSNPSMAEGEKTTAGSPSLLLSWRRRRWSLEQPCPPFTSGRRTASTRTPLDERSRAPRSDWLSAASLNAALFPGCSCQATVEITSDAINRRPASPRASVIQPQNKKSCKWECLLYHTVFFGCFTIFLKKV